MALGTGGGRLHLAQESIPDLPDITAAVAGVAGFFRTFVLSSRSSAGSAAHLFFDRYFFRDPGGNFIEVQRDADPQA